MHSYELIDGGYQIFRQGRLYIHQPFAPGEAGHRAMGAEEATAAAEQLIAELETPAGKYLDTVE